MCEVLLRYSSKIYCTFTIYTLLLKKKKRLEALM